MMFQLGTFVFISSLPFIKCMTSNLSNFQSLYLYYGENKVPTFDGHHHE